MKNEDDERRPTTDDDDDDEKVPTDVVRMAFTQMITHTQSLWIVRKNGFAACL